MVTSGKIEGCYEAPGGGVAELVGENVMVDETSAHEFKSTLEDKRVHVERNRRSGIQAPFLFFG